MSISLDFLIGLNVFILLFILYLLFSDTLNVIFFLRIQKFYVKLMKIYYMIEDAVNYIYKMSLKCLFILEMFVILVNRVNT